MRTLDVSRNLRPTAPGEIARRSSEGNSRTRQRRWSVVAACGLLAVFALVQVGRGNGMLAAVDAYNIGRYHYSCGAFAKAVEAYSQALRLNPKYAGAYLGRGKAYQQLGDHENAVADCTLTLKIHSRNSEALLIRGDSFAALGENEQAMADYCQALELEPQSTLILRHRSELYHTCGREDYAAADLAAAAKIDPLFEFQPMTQQIIAPTTALERKPPVAVASDPPAAMQQPAIVSPRPALAFRPPVVAARPPMEPTRARAAAPALTAPLPSAPATDTAADVPATPAKPAQVLTAPNPSSRRKVECEESAPATAPPPTDQARSEPPTALGAGIMPALPRLPRMGADNRLKVPEPAGVMGNIARDAINETPTPLTPPPVEASSPQPQPEVEQVAGSPSAGLFQRSSCPTLLAPSEAAVPGVGTVALSATSECQPVLPPIPEIRVDLQQDATPPAQASLAAATTQPASEPSLLAPPAEPAAKLVLTQPAEVEPPEEQPLRPRDPFVKDSAPPTKSEEVAAETKPDVAVGVDEKTTLDPILEPAPVRDAAAEAATTAAVSSEMGASIQTPPELTDEVKPASASSPVDARLAETAARVAEFDRQLAEFPGEAKFYFQRAELLQDLGRNDEALDDANACLRLAPDRAECFCLRATIYTALGRYDAALNDFERALEIMPGAADIYFQRAATLGLAGKWHEAIEDYDVVVRLDPPAPSAIAQRGFAYLHLGERAEAELDFEAAMRCDSESTPAHLGKAIAARLSGDIDGALAELDRVLRLDPALASAFHERSLCYAAKGDTQEAAAAERRAAELDRSASQPAR